MILWWACADSNCRPLPCQGSACRHLRALTLKANDLFVFKVSRKCYGEAIFWRNLSRSVTGFEGHFLMPWTPLRQAEGEQKTEQPPTPGVSASYAQNVDPPYQILCQKQPANRVCRQPQCVGYDRSPNKPGGISLAAWDDFRSRSATFRKPLKTKPPGQLPAVRSAVHRPQRSGGPRMAKKRRSPGVSKTKTTLYARAKER